MKKKSIKAEEFDSKFEQGDDIRDYLNISKSFRASQIQECKPKATRKKKK